MKLPTPSNNAGFVWSLGDLLIQAKKLTTIAGQCVYESTDQEIAESLESLIPAMEAHRSVILTALRKAEKGAQS